MSENETRDFGIGSPDEPIGVTMDRWHRTMDVRPRYANGGRPSQGELDSARTELARYMNGARDVLRLDVPGRPPAFVDVLWDDLESPPSPPWPVPAIYTDNRSNSVYEVAFGSYAWWVRRLNKTVASVTD